MSDDDKVIRFPGSVPAKTKADSQPVPNLEKVAQEGFDPQRLSHDREKAVQLILAGLPFVFVAIRPTPTGADFFTAIDGAPEDLRNAHDSLPGVIDRLYERKGL